MDRGTRVQTYRDVSEWHIHVGFEVLTVVVTKSSVFWDIPFNPSKVERHFRGTCHLHPQG
jgi:hypothetical protein